MIRAHHSILWIMCGAVLVSTGLAEVPPDDPRVTPVVIAYRKARSAVVDISTEKIVQVRYGVFGGDLFDDVFAFRSPFSRRIPVKSLGSGVLINPGGYIVTNAHVVRQAQKITVTLFDESKYQARAISSDSDNDLAVLKIDLPPGVTLPHLPLGRSDDLMVGETVIAIGNPLGYANSLTTGVISATDRTLTFSRSRGADLRIRGLIQTSAPINPGNSGGPLLNIKGDLIGFNSAIRADAQNIGFAIPVDRLADELGNLLDFEGINRVIFGAVVTQRHGTLEDELRVTEVREGTPAHGKLRVGDRIVALNGKPMRQIPDYACAMLDVRAGDTLRVKCIRGSKELVVEVKVAAKPAPDGAALAMKLFGLTLKPVTSQLARDLRLRVNQGLLVVGVEAGSPAHRLGIELKDVILQVGRLYVNDLDSLGAVLEDVSPGQTVNVGLVRGNHRLGGVQIRARPEP